MKTMFAALVLTNLVWAGYAMSQSDDPDTLLMRHGHLMVGVIPAGDSTVLKVDAQGYAICSLERPKP